VARPAMGTRAEPRGNASEAVPVRRDDTGGAGLSVEGASLVTPETRGLCAASTAEHSAGHLDGHDQRRARWP